MRMTCGYSLLRTSPQTEPGKEFLMSESASSCLLYTEGAERLTKNFLDWLLQVAAVGRGRSFPEEHHVYVRLLKRAMGDGSSYAIVS